MVLFVSRRQTWPIFSWLASFFWKSKDDLGNKKGPLPQDNPTPPMWHSLPSYVKDSRSGLDSCLEFIQEIAEIHRLMGKEQREKEKSLPHRDQKSLTCHWFEEKLFCLDRVIRSCPLCLLIIFPMLDILISHPMSSDSQWVEMPSHSINPISHSQGMTM